MKKILPVFICALIALSCQKELSEEDGTLPTTPTTPGTPGTPANTICFECEYAPICDSTKLVYMDTILGNASVVTNLYDVLGDTTMSGVANKKVIELNSGQIAYFSCSNNIVRAFFYSGTSTGGSTVTNITQTPVKANEPVGATWKDVVNNNNGQLVEYRYTIIAKNTTRQVLDSSYSNVIYVRDTTVLIVPGFGEIPSAVRHSYFAKGIGQVETNIEDLVTGLPISQRKLKSYKIR
jgi:hypothetical protein